MTEMTTCNANHKKILKSISELLNKDNKHIKLMGLGDINTINNMYYLHFKIDDINIRIDTDFKTFIFIKNDNTDKINMFNTLCAITSKTVASIVDNLLTVFNPIIPLQINDSYNLFNNQKIITKCEIDYDKLTKTPNTIIIGNQSKLMKDTVIHKLIINEMKNINFSQNYSHYVEPINNNLFEWTIKLFINPETILGKHAPIINLSISLDSSGYPYIAPKIKYISPNMKIDFMFSLMDLDILNQSNWSHVISLEKLILTIVNQLEQLDTDYTDTNTDKLYQDIMYLGYITKTIKYEKVNFKFDIKKIQTIKTGVGYGSDVDTKWDYNQFISNRKQHNREHAECLAKLIDTFKKEKISTTHVDLIYCYIDNNIKGINLLEFQENTTVYIIIFEIIDILIEYFDQKMINNIREKLDTFCVEIINLLSMTKDKNDIYKNFIAIFNKIKSKYVEQIKEIKISDDNKVNYCNQMSKLQFGHYDLPETHLFYSKRNDKIEQKSVMRILSEISSLKQNLPLNWETSIWIRVSKTHFNFLTVLIAGPKDTPYENGLFEFHIYLPVNYPNSPPSVLLKTTGNETVRFNPNLYASGKVCLSLLGTWAGASGESWSPKSSSLLQVLVSIQSLILINHPYFNEPGYEKYINNKEWINTSIKYNEEKQPHTINLAMINMLKNPIVGFEDVIKQHFQFKKDEIINKLNIWEQDNKTTFVDIFKYKEELLELLH